MESLIVFGIWLLATLIITSVTIYIGKTFGREYPIAVMAALIVISNIIAVQLISIGPFLVPAGIIVFSMTFMITDILTELYGPKIARKAVWSGFLANAIFLIAIYFMQLFPAAGTLDILAQTPRIILASVIAYLVSQHFDVWYFETLKSLTAGRHLWLRNNLSTVSSQLIDSVIFISIAFYGLVPIIPLILGQWAIKCIIALIDTPFVYLLVGKQNTKRARKIVSR